MKKKTIKPIQQVLLAALKNPQLKNVEVIYNRIDNTTALRIFIHADAYLYITELTPNAAKQLNLDLQDMPTTVCVNYMRLSKWWYAPIRLKTYALKNVGRSAISHYNYTYGTAAAIKPFINMLGVLVADNKTAHTRSYNPIIRSNCNF